MEEASEPKKPRILFDGENEFPTNNEEWIKYVLSAKDLDIGHARCLTMRTFQQNKTEHLVNCLELHTLTRFGDDDWMVKFINESVLAEGQVFWKEFVLYASDYLYNVTEIEELNHFKYAFNTKKPKEDWLDVFVSSAHNNPEKAAEIYAAFCMLYPGMSGKVVNKAITAIIKKGNIPGCLELFVRSICAFPLTVNFKRDDGSSILRKYIYHVFKKFVQEPDPYIENPMGISKRRLDQAQEDFLNTALRPSARIMNNLGSMKGKSPLDVFLKTPETVEIKHNMELFQTFFFAYFRIGMFDLVKGYHLIAWNRYFDDRYYHEDNSWIFPSGFVASPIRWKTEWDYLNDIPEKDKIRTNVYAKQFKMLSKLFEFFKFSDKFGLLKKYGQDEFVQYFAIALTYNEEYEKFDKLFDFFNEKYTEGNVFLCLNINALLIAAKRENLRKVIDLWKKIVKYCVLVDKLEAHRTSKYMFKHPRFVGAVHISDIATKILRNFLFIQATKQGVAGFEKYGTLLLFMARANWDYFVPFNMMHELINNIPEEKFGNLLKESFPTLTDMSNSALWEYIYEKFPSTHETFFTKELISGLYQNKPCEVNFAKTLLEKLEADDPVMKCIK
ncbi:unnamed protein product [Caenorhabditis angaria]|uniref:Uncharacterized protein n=1 Tax=Caenorhabditis angaria TaxID=860376 RepID=A0A9P1J427_9PELO|nr:unnamed protein product [Caenorhabditis angaria]